MKAALRVGLVAFLRMLVRFSQNTAYAESVVSAVAVVLGTDIARIEAQDASILWITDRARPVAAVVACTTKGAAVNATTPRQIKGSIHKVSSISSKVIIIKNI